MWIRILSCVAILLSADCLPVRAAEQSIGEKIKSFFVTPTPTPKPHKKKTTTSTKKASEKSTASEKKKSSSTAAEKTSEPSGTPKSTTKQAESKETTETPTPGKKKKRASPTASPTPTASRHRKKSFSTPEPSETPAASISPAPAVSPEASASSPSVPEQSATANGSKHRASNASLTLDSIKGSENYPPNVQRLLASALDLTTRNLTYKYGSADPSNGGMDCSGFVYFVLKQNGIEDVPRDSSEQYVWLRRTRNFEPVLSQKDNSFELDDLKPGDLLFWTGTYDIERDPPITHAMIYLGRQKGSGERVMVGASDGRVYQGEARNGVSVFDFKISRARQKFEDGRLHPQFVGYGHIPGLRQ